jgi:hypothetical protein
MRAAHKVLLTRILEGDGHAPRSLRRAAFDNAGLTEPLRTLIDGVAKQATQVTDKRSVQSWQLPWSSIPESLGARARAGDWPTR